VCVRSGLGVGPSAVRKLAGWLSKRAGITPRYRGLLENKYKEALVANSEPGRVGTYILLHVVLR